MGDDYPGLTIRIPLVEYRAMNNALICLRQLLRTDHLDPAGGLHTNDCLTRRHAGIPGCTQDCYAVREAVQATAQIKAQ